MRKSVNIWLDDIREAPEGWIPLKNIEGVEKLVEIMLQRDDLYIEEMSFDFHLNHPKLGIDVMKYLAELCVEHKTRRFWAKTILLHSNDPNGIRTMEKFAKKFESETLSKL